MDLSLCLKAMADPTRLAIFRQLFRRRHCTRSLSRALGVSEPAVSQHLKLLREADMVVWEQYGRHRHYRPSQEALEFLCEAFGEMRRELLQSDAGAQCCPCACGRRRDAETGKSSEAAPSPGDGHSCRSDRLIKAGG